MAVRVVRVERRRDGKFHPAGGYHTPAEIELATGLIHAMRCGRSMSFRAITAALPEHGVWISLGSVVRYWQATECDRCAPAPAEAPRPAPVPSRPPPARPSAPRRVRAEVYQLR